MNFRKIHILGLLISFFLIGLTFASDWETKSIVFWGFETDGNYPNSPRLAIKFTDVNKHYFLARELSNTETLKYITALLATATSNSKQLTLLVNNKNAVNPLIYNIYVNQ